MPTAVAQKLPSQLAKRSLQVTSLHAFTSSVIFRTGPLLPFRRGIIIDTCSMTNKAAITFDRVSVVDDGDGLVCLSAVGADDDDVETAADDLVVVISAVPGDELPAGAHLAARGQHVADLLQHGVPCMG